jgi:hypothetical protein
MRLLARLMASELAGPDPFVEGVTQPQTSDRHALQQRGGTERNGGTEGGIQVLAGQVRQCVFFGSANAIGHRGEMRNGAGVIGELVGKAT